MAIDRWYIRHYIRHGSLGCAKCNEGFLNYWIVGRRS